MATPNGYSVYSTKPGASDSKTWRWILTPEGTNLSRRQAALLAQAIKARDAALRVVVYAFGSFKYTV